MSTEEVITIAIGKLINWLVILIAGYFWLVINHIKKDINNVANYARQVNDDVQRLEEVATCIKIQLGKLQQYVDDNRTVCDERHKKSRK